MKNTFPKCLGWLNLFWWKKNDQFSLVGVLKSFKKIKNLLNTN